MGLNLLGEAFSRIAGSSRRGRGGGLPRGPHQLFEALTEGHPKEAHRDRGGLAVIHNDLGTSLRQARPILRGRGGLPRGAEHYEGLLVTHPEDFGIRYELSVMLYNLGTICHLANHRTEAEGPYRRAKDLLEKLVADRPDVVELSLPSRRRTRSTWAPS